MSTECRSGRGGGLQTRSYPVRVRIGAPMPGWRNVYALASEPSSRSGVRVQVSPRAPNLNATEGAGEWSPSRLENGGRVRIRGVRFLRPLPQAGVLLGEQPVSKAGAQCSNHCTGARSSKRAGGVRRARVRNRGRGGREATALLTRHASRIGATGFDSQALCQVSRFK